MNLVKIGNFIKELRKEKNLSQEQLAEVFNVSRRTVSRWETGNNMPDMSILVGMADYFGVDLREIFDGERKNLKMNEETKDIALKVTEYESKGKKRVMKITLAYFIIGIVSMIINLGMRFFDLPETFAFGFLEGFTAGMPIVAMVFGILYVTGVFNKICRKINRK